MLAKLDIYIIFLPFISVLVSSILFLFFQLFSNKNYLSNLIISFFVIFFLILIIIYKLSSNLNDQEIFYLIFAYLCSSYIFMCLIQAPISSLQLTILRIIYLNPGISRKEIIKKYNSKHIFEERIRRLEATDIIYRNKSSFFLKNKKILLYLNFLLILKKLFNIKN
tara:strand:- start:294 stop:791 length:498 start_codon:yes stop_codon:yes gene_type:complete